MPQGYAKVHLNDHQVTEIDRIFRDKLRSLECLRLQQWGRMLMVRRAFYHLFVLEDKARLEGVVFCLQFCVQFMHVHAICLPLSRFCSGQSLARWQ